MVDVGGSLMAHFAQLDETNTVLRVIVVHDDDTASDGVEIEAVGIATLKQRYGADTNWVQTSYNRNMRTHYASIGGTYHPERDVFLYAQPFPSWVLTADHNWEAPVPYPDDGPNYYWDEDSGSWIEIEMPEE